MFLKREIYEQLVKQAAQCEFYKESLVAAQTRAEEAEKALAGERSGRDWIVNQLTSRVVTKHGQYGLEHAPLPPAPNPQRFIREPTEHDLAMLEFYKQCAVQAGQPEEDGERKWEAMMRGEPVAIESESEQ